MLSFRQGSQGAMDFWRNAERVTLPFRLGKFAHGLEYSGKLTGITIISS